MTIHVTIKNEDSRANAVIEIIKIDDYRPADRVGTPAQSIRTFTSEGLLKGGESKTVMIYHDNKLEIIERQNG
jgi:hypothetical protein